MSTFKRLVSALYIFECLKDARKHRLVLRFRCSDANMAGTVGFLGFDNQAGSGDLSAVGIVESCMRIWKALCAPDDAPPFSNSKRIQFPEAMSEICRKVELFDADGAKDEQLAGEFSEAIYPNLKAVNKDVSHAMRRIDKRCTEADPFLQDTIMMFILGKKSPARLLQNSEVFKERFSRHAFANNGMKVKDLRAAKHRHESIQKPRGRQVVLVMLK